MVAQDSAPTVRRKVGRPFVKGQSGNPSGRPRGVAAIIQDLCGGADYPDLWRAYYALAFGSDADRKAMFGSRVKVDAGIIVQALDRLRDSGYGRPVQTLAHEGVPSAPLFVIMPGGARPAITRAQDGLEDIDAVACLQPRASV